jgi:tRNA 2-thiouridine synthesizing protein A
MTHHVLDARNLLCPMPVIRTQQMVAKLAPGDTLEVRATDPGVLHDIPAWCRVHKHEVLSAGPEADEIRVTLRVNP